MRRLSALLLLGALAATASADVPGLVKKLSSKDNEERRDAAKGLGDLGKGAKAAVPSLVKALKDDDRFVRRWSAEALGKIGPDAKDSIPALEKLLEDGSQPVRLAAVKALANMGPTALAALTKALAATGDVQEHAVPALAELGEPAAPALAGAIKNAKMSPELRKTAVTAVGKMGKAGHVAVPMLASVAKDPKAGGQPGQQLRMEAITTLGRLATKEDKEAVAVLDEITKDEKGNRQVKDVATKALQAIQTKK